jgi:hypothetical protein
LFYAASQPPMTEPFDLAQGEQNQTEQRPTSPTKMAWPKDEALFSRIK